MNTKKNTVLVPLNFSEYSQKALALAAEVAGRWRAKLLILHVVDIPDYYEVGGEERNNFLKAVTNNVKSKLEIMAGQAALSGVDAHVMVKEGKVGAAIIDVLNQEQVALVVLGSKNYNRMAEVLAGSASERILRYATCPVLTVKDETVMAGLKNIVFATDFKSTPLFVSDQLRKLQLISGAKLHVLKVNTRESWMSDKEAEKHMEAFNDIHHFDNYTFHVTNSETVEDGIIHYYKTVNAQLVAMAIHTLHDQPSVVNNYFITEKVLQSMPGLLWTCPQRMI